MNVVWSFELHVIFSVLALLLVEEEGGVFVNEDFKTDWSPQVHRCRLC
jgi:hypothetical protein